MRRWVRALVCRVVVVALIAVALVAVGFGHRMPTASETALESYILAGGDISALCGGAGDDQGLAGSDCPACHLAAATILPDPPVSIVKADLIFVAKVVAPRESRARRVVLDPAHGMRAPPLA